MTYQAEVTELQYQDSARNSSKFYRAYHIWDDEALDHRVVFQWGRIGSKGQSQVLIVHTEGQAAITVSGKLRDKQDKGYRTVYDKTLPGVSLDLLHLAGITETAAAANVRSQDPVKVLLVDVDTCRRLAMGDGADVTKAVVMRRSLAEQLDALRASVQDAEGQVEVVDMVLNAKLASA